MKQTISWFLAFMLIFSSACLIRDPQSMGEWKNPYVDVTQDMWSYQYITELHKAGIFPKTDSDKLGVQEEETRGNLAVYLYNMNDRLFGDKEKERKKERKKSKTELPQVAFTDVSEDSPYYEAVEWVVQNGVMGGESETTFRPDGLITRQQICTIVVRFAALEDIPFIKVSEDAQMEDSLEIADYARSSVTACQMAGVASGYDNGYFLPENTVSRETCATFLYRVMTKANMEVPEGSELVDLTPGAYDAVYANYKEKEFVALVPQAETAGPASFFDQAVFIGDSISMTLEMYANSSKALGQAKFLCAGSMSPSNMLTGQILPEYPKGSGQKPAIEDSVAATGAKVVYIMLGMDNIAFGIERATSDYLTVINNILAKNPDVQIIIQSVTPMADQSTSYSEKLNNDKINEFNETMRGHCQENEWYYLNVAEAFRDAEGFLKKEYCSDYSTMGMHFTFNGAKVWVDYLLSHIPEDLLEG